MAVEPLLKTVLIELALELLALLLGLASHLGLLETSLLLQPIEGAGQPAVSLGQSRSREAQHEPDEHHVTHAFSVHPP